MKKSELRQLIREELLKEIYSNADFEDDLEEGLDYLNKAISKLHIPYLKNHTKYYQLGSFVDDLKKLDKVYRKRIKQFITKGE